jgi:hypothetical protein
MKVNSASGTACTPLAVTTTTPLDGLSVDLHRVGDLLAGAGVARLDPAQVRRAAGRVHQPRPGRAGDPEQHLGSFQKFLPAIRIGREIAGDVTHVARRRDHRCVV